MSYLQLLEFKELCVGRSARRYSSGMRHEWHKPCFISGSALILGPENSGFVSICLYDGLEDGLEDGMTRLNWIKRFISSVLLYMQIVGPWPPCPLARAGEVPVVKQVTAAAPAGPLANSVANERMDSIFGERAVVDLPPDKTWPLDPVKHLEDDFNAMLADMRKARLLDPSAEETFWNFWKNHHDELLNRGKLKEYPKDFTAAAFFGQVYVLAGLDKAASNPDARAKKGMIGRTLGSIGTYLTFSNIVEGGAWKLWALASGLVGLIWAGLSLGTVMNISNQIFALFQNSIGQGLAARFTRIERVQKMGAALDLFFRPSGTANLHAADSADGIRMDSLAQLLSSASGKPVSRHEAGKLWNSTNSDIAVWNQVWKSGIGPDAQTARGQYMNALVFNPMNFSGAMVNVHVMWETHRQGLEDLLDRLPKMYGIGEEQLQAGLALGDKISLLREKGRPSEEIAKLEAVMKKLIELMKEEARSTLANRVKELSAKEGGNARPERVQAQVEIMEKRIEQLFEHQRAMRRASMQAGTIAASWVKNTLALPEHNILLPQVQRAHIASMDELWGFKYFTNQFPQFQDPYNAAKAVLKVDPDRLEPERVSVDRRDAKAGPAPSKESLKSADPSPVKNPPRRCLAAMMRALNAH